MPKGGLAVRADAIPLWQSPGQIPQGLQIPVDETGFQMFSFRVVHLRIASIRRSGSRAPSALLLFTGSAPATSSLQSPQQTRTAMSKSFFMVCFCSFALCPPSNFSYPSNFSHFSHIFLAMSGPWRRSPFTSPLARHNLPTGKNCRWVNFTDR